MIDSHEPAAAGTVVVGVDDSPGAHAALLFAFRDAARRGAAVRVASAYLPPDYTQVWLAASRGADLTEDDEFTAEVRTGVEQMVAEVCTEMQGEPMPTRVDIVVAAGAPAPVLIDLSDGADLLVVGSRGRGGFASMALGSVGMQVVLHARCPVTVVRGGSQAGGDGQSEAGREPAESRRAPVR